CDSTEHAKEWAIRVAILVMWVLDERENRQERRLVAHQLQSFLAHRCEGAVRGLAHYFVGRTCAKDFQDGPLGAILHPCEQPDEWLGGHTVGQRFEGAQCRIALAWRELSR